MTLNQGIIWVLAQRRDTWGKVYPDEEKENVFPASCQIIAESHPRICGGVEEGEGIACSWNVLRVGIFSDSTWCITTVVLNYIVCCSREEEKKKMVWMRAASELNVLYAFCEVAAVCFGFNRFNITYCFFYLIHKHLFVKLKYGWLNERESQLGM